MIIYSNLRVIRMSCALAMALLSVGAFSASVESFDRDALGSLPTGWKQGVTGSGVANWAVVADGDAPSKQNVLQQSGVGTFLWCTRENSSLEDGFVEVKFKPISGNEDQAGGLVWRFKDANNYYIARANALEDNVTIYHTINGRRVAFSSTNIKVDTRKWHQLRVEFQGNNFIVIFDGKPVIKASDNSIRGAGAVGMWTKADSVTAFDNFSFGK